MEPTIIKGANRAFHAPEGMDDCATLHVLQETHGGVPFLSSEWVPSADEREAIARGANIILIVVGGGHPPVGLTVADTLDRVE